MTASASNTITYEGCNFFRQRLILATLSGRPVRITAIRSDANEPGLTDYEVSFIRLMDKVTNGSKIDINSTGTAIYYKPGIISSVGTVKHDCPLSRGIGYFLEALVCIAPFAKKPIKAFLTGITNNNQDPSADMFRTVTMPLLRQFGMEGVIELKILKRGAPPQGGGEIMFACENIQALKPIRLTEMQKIKRIRGIAYVTRMSPQTANRMVEASRGLLNEYIPDVFVYSDHYKGAESGKSPGFGCTLVAETIDGRLISAERMAVGGERPEDVGTDAGRLLFEEIARGGVVDTQNQVYALLFAVLASEDVSKIRLGMLSPYTVEFMRHVRDFFGVTMRLKPDEDDNSIIVTCKGLGFSNIAKGYL